MSGEFKRIEIKISGTEIDFEVARKIAEAIAEYYNREIKGYWDAGDGDHEPPIEEYTDLDDLCQKFDEKVKNLGAEFEVDIDGQYLFYF